MRDFDNLGPRLVGALLFGLMAAGAGALVIWMGLGFGPPWLIYGIGAAMGHMLGSRNRATR